MSVAGAKQRRLHILDPGQMGFVHYEILSRIWIEGTLRIRDLNEQMTKEVVAAFSAAYPHECEKVSTQKIRRVFNEMRPVRTPQDVSASTTPLSFEYSEPVKRHAALFSMQQQATRVLEASKQMLAAEVVIEPSSAEFAEHLASLSSLHQEFEDWCTKYGRDVVAATNTRNDLRHAVEQLNNVSFATSTQRDEDNKEPESSSFLRGTKSIAEAISSNNHTFLKRALKLADLHTTYIHQLEVERKRIKRHDGSAPAASSSQMTPIISASDSVRELESEISNTEKTLLALYEKKRKFCLASTVTAHKRDTKFLAFFLIPDGKMKHFSIGLDCDTGDESLCQLALAKHGYVSMRKGKRIKHYTSK